MDVVNTLTFLETVNGLDEAANAVVMGTDREKIPELEALAARVFPEIPVIVKPSAPVIMCQTALRKALKKE